MSEDHEYLLQNVRKFKNKTFNTKLMVKLWSNVSLWASKLVY